MNPAEYDRMYGAEDHYWWYRSRRELVVDAASRLGLPPGATVVDVGCGTGATARDLGRFGRVIGVDFSTLALGLCRRRGLNDLLRGSAESLPMADGSADLIVATDILEHLDDDRAALAEFRRVLRPGGHLVATVPAYQFLWSEHDEALMHRRRYVSGELGRRADAAGFERVRLGYALSLLFPLALGRLLRGRRPSGRPPEAQVKPVPPLVNEALVRFQRFENGLLRFLPLPWGLSVVAVLRRPAAVASLPHRPAARPMVAAGLR